jgi:hypothetical protein
MPASVEGVASLFLSSSHTSCPTLSQATGKTAGLRHRHQTNGTPIAHQVVMPLGQDGTALSVTFLIDVEILLRNATSSPFEHSMPFPTHSPMQIFTDTGLYLQHPV